MKSYSCRSRDIHPSPARSVVNRAALAGGLVLLATLRAPAAVPTSTFSVQKPAQPWPGRELAAADTNGTAVFELKQPVSPALLAISGEVLLPSPGAALVLPDLSVALGKDARTVTVVAGSGKAIRRATFAVSNDVKTAWMPFAATRRGNLLSVSVGTASLAHTNPPTAGQSCAVTVQGGARARAVSVTTVPPGMAPVNLQACASETRVLKEPNAGAVLDPVSLLPGGGVALLDGVPFLVGDKSVDVRLSMAGTDFSRRLKWGYYTVPSSPRRPVGVVPGNSYETLHVLAYSRQIPGHVPRMTVNYGQCVSWAGPMEEDVVPVPDAKAGGESAYVQSRVAVKLSDGSDGWLYHLRIPVARAASAWFAGDTEFEFTRDRKDLHNLPDPNEYARVPVGLPSSVVVVAATAERSPVGFAYVLDVPGNVFDETQDPVLKISLTNRLSGEFKGRISARSAGPGLPEEDRPLRAEWTVETAVTLKPGEQREIPVRVMPTERKKRGWFEVDLSILSDGKPVQMYRTTYAVLAPDTRKAMADSPFGTWEFWWPHASYARADRQVLDAATLMNKGGWRWTYGGSLKERARGPVLTSEELFDRFKVTFTIRNLSQSYQRGTGWWNATEFEKTVAPAVRAAAASPVRGEDRAYKVLHESRSSDVMLRRLSEYLGGDPYAMPDAERQQIDQQFSNVVKYCAAIKQADPKAKICLINDYPGVGVEYMKRGFPKDLFDAFGSEGAMFMREPERQPDWLCLLGVMQNWKRAKDQYGYQDKPIWTTEALYHGTSPAYLTLHAQGVIQVREAMLALANGVERMCAAGCIRDCTDDYRWSNWGQVGFCFREPEMNPKPSYAMYAWLTQILDQAKYAGKVDHDSTSLHILDFRTAAGGHVYPLWCVRGRQDVTLLVKGGQPALIDAYGNPLPAQVSDGRLTVAVRDTPAYLTGTVVDRVVARTPVEEKEDGGTPIVRFDRPGVFTVETGASRILESNWDYPRIKGTYAVNVVQEDGVSAVRLELQDDADARKLLQRYVELKLAQPVVLKDRVDVFTARVKGNGGWGRLMYELVDAEGRVWTACGNQYAGSCNASDNRGDSYISFDGWRTVIIDPPGRYPATDLVAYRPSTTEWWPENTPEWKQQQADHEKAKAAYEQAMKAFPDKERAYEEARQAYEAKQAEYKQAKAAYDKEQTAYTAARKVYAKSRADYDRARTAYDKAVREGKPVAATPVAPVEPAVPSLAVPVPPGEAPKPVKAPPSPGLLRNYGIATMTYPVKLTKVILASSPHLLYVNDEVPVKQRTVLIEQIGVRLEPREGLPLAVR